MVMFYFLINQGKEQFRDTSLNSDSHNDNKRVTSHCL